MCSGALYTQKRSHIYARLPLQLVPEVYGLRIHCALTNGDKQLYSYKGIFKRDCWPSGSGKGHVIKRCPNCGDQIYSHFMGLNNLLVLKTTTLSNANEVPPQAHVFLDSKLEWLKLNDDIPKFDKFYRREEIYSDESLKRMKIALQ